MRPLVLLLLFMPLASFAASVPAGFPASSLWLSRTDLTDGESVTIYTVVYNSSDASVALDVTFKVDAQVLGTKSITAAPGTTQIVSHAWSAEEGSHAFTAHLSGDVTELAATNTATTSVSVAPKPPPPEAVLQTVAAATAVESAIASTTPVVQNIASSTFATTESIRASTVKVLEKLASSTTPKGEVLGAEDEQPITPEENAATSFDISAWIQNIWQALLGALLFIARSPLWFYIAVAAVFFFILAFLRAAVSDRNR